MTHLSKMLYSFYYIDDLGHREYVGACIEEQFEEYLNELLEGGYLMADLTWDTELWEDEIPD